MGVFAKSQRVEIKPISGMLSGGLQDKGEKLLLDTGTLWKGLAKKVIQTENTEENLR